MARAVFAAAIAFTTLLAGLTVYVVIAQGPTVLTVASVLVLALFVFGIFGALSTPPDRRR